MLSSLLFLSSFSPNIIISVYLSFYLTKTSPILLHRLKTTETGIRQSKSTAPGVGFIFLHKTIGSEKVKNPKSWWASETVTTKSKRTPITSAHRRNLLAHLGSEKKGKSKAQKPASPSLSS